MDRQDEPISPRGQGGARDGDSNGIGAQWCQRDRGSLPRRPDNSVRAATAAGISPGRAQTAGGGAGPRPKHPRLIPSIAASGAAAGGRRRQDVLDGVSSPEIAQLVSGALESALLAFGSDNPGDFLQLRAFEARKKMREMLNALPAVQATCPDVQAEYRKGVVFQNVALDLAFQIMGAIDRYARAIDRHES